MACALLDIATEFPEFFQDNWPLLRITPVLGKNRFRVDPVDRADFGPRPFRHADFDSGTYRRIGGEARVKPEPVFENADEAADLGIDAGFFPGLAVRRALRRFAGVSHTRRESQFSAAPVAHHQHPAIQPDQATRIAMRRFGMLRRNPAYGRRRGRLQRGEKEHPADRTGQQQPAVKE